MQEFEISKGVEEELKRAAADGAFPAGLTVTYDDRHGLWGGTIVTVRGDGSIERAVRPCGGDEESKTRANAGGDDLAALTRLLVDLAAWEQRTPDRAPVPDESRATLIIEVRGQSTRIWERVNEMQGNGRLSRIKASMDKMIDP